MAKETKRAKGEKMNKEYWEYYFSKKKKLTDRAFKLRIAMLMTSMLACAAVMASSAFALFTCDINRTTTLTAAEFKIVNSYTRDARTIGEKIVTINTTPGVVGYCKITVIDPDEVQHWYYTNAFCGTMNLRITAAAECQIIVDTPRWGYPQLNGIAPELIIGDGGTINIPIPETQEITSNESSETSGSEEASSNELLASGGDGGSSGGTGENASVQENTSNPPESTSGEVASEAENDAPVTATPSESETPVSSSPPPDSGNASDSGNTTAADSSHSSTSGEGSSGSSESNSSSSATSDSSVGSSSSTSAPVSSASSDDSGTSSGSDASAGGSPPSSSDGGGE